MKKGILTILFWLLSVSYLCLIINILWKNNHSTINRYKWGNSYANETRNYFLFDGINSYGANDWEYFNFNDEPIYFEKFDFLIQTDKTPYSLMSSEEKCEERGGNWFPAKNCSVPFDINNFTGEAIKLHVSHCISEDETENPDLPPTSGFYCKRSGPSQWAGGIATKRIYTFLSVSDENSSKLLKSSIDENFKFHQIKSNSSSKNNIKCKMSFKNGKAHGKKIIYNDPVFFFDSIGLKWWNDHLHNNFFRSKTNITPYFIINLSKFKSKGNVIKNRDGFDAGDLTSMDLDYDLIDNYVEESGNKYNFISDSIVENYNEGLLTDLEIWRTNCTLTHSTNLHKNANILSQPTIQLKIIKPGKQDINYSFKNIHAQNKDLMKYYPKFEFLNETLEFKFEKPTLIHESHNSNGVLNPVQFHFKENVFKTDSHYKINWEFLNRYIGIIPYLIFYLLGQAILIYAYYSFRKKLVKI